MEPLSAAWTTLSYRAKKSALSSVEAGELIMYCHAKGTRKMLTPCEVKWGTCSTPASVGIQVLIDGVLPQMSTPKSRPVHQHTCQHDSTASCAQERERKTAPARLIPCRNGVPAVEAGGAAAALVEVSFALVVAALVDVEVTRAVLLLEVTTGARDDVELVVTGAGAEAAGASRHCAYHSFWTTQARPAPQPGWPVKPLPCRMSQRQVSRYRHQTATGRSKQASRQRTPHWAHLPLAATTELTAPRTASAATNDNLAMAAIKAVKAEGSVGGLGLTRVRCRKASEMAR